MPPITNPYLKNKKERSINHAIHNNVFRGKASPTNPAVTSVTRKPAAVTPNPHIKSTPSASSWSRPQPKQVTVTPSPKTSKKPKLPQDHTHLSRNKTSSTLVVSSSPTTAGVASSRPSVAKKNPQQPPAQEQHRINNYNGSKQGTAVAKRILPPMKKTPKSLKAKLKWDIAQLKRKKILEKQQKEQKKKLEQQQQQRMKEEAQKAKAKEEADKLRRQQEAEKEAAAAAAKQRKLQLQDQEKKRKVAMAIAAAQKEKEQQQQQFQKLQQQQQQQQQQHQHAAFQWNSANAYASNMAVAPKKNIPAPFPILTGSTNSSSFSTTTNTNTVRHVHVPDSTPHSTPSSSTIACTPTPNHLLSGREGELVPLNNEALASSGRSSNIASQPGTISSTTCNVSDDCKKNNNVTCVATRIPTGLPTNANIVCSSILPSSSYSINKDSDNNFNNNFNNNNNKISKTQNEEQQQKQQQKEIRGIMEEMILIVTARIEAPYSRIGDPNKRSLASQLLFQPHHPRTQQTFQQHHQQYQLPYATAYNGYHCKQQQQQYPSYPLLPQSQHNNWTIPSYNNGGGGGVVPINPYHSTLLGSGTGPGDGSRKQYTTYPRKKKIKPLVLHREPMIPPSPYATSHEIIKESIIIVKEKGKSFGVNIRYETKSTLVDPPPPPPPLPSSKTSTSSSSSPPPLLPSSSSSCTPVLNHNDKQQQQNPQSHVAIAPSSSVSTIVTPHPRITTSNNNSNNNNDSNNQTKLLDSTAVVLSDNTHKNEKQDDCNIGKSESSKPAVVESSVSIIAKLAASVTAANHDPSLSKEAKVSSSVPLSSSPNNVKVATTSKSATSTIGDEKSSISLPTNPEPPHHPQKRRRRKRVFFGTMTVLDAIKQSQIYKEVDNHNPTSKKEQQLQPGDVILSINGQSTLGLTFQQACGLFSTCNTPFEKKVASPPKPTLSTKELEDHAITNVPEKTSSSCEKKWDDSSKSGTKLEYISCSLKVARLKPKPVEVTHVKSRTSSSSSSSRLVQSSSTLSVSPSSSVTNYVAPPLLIKGDLSKAEIADLVWTMVERLKHPMRPLGFTTAISNVDVLSECFRKSPLLVRRDPSTLQNKWFQTINTINVRADAAARDVWKKEWKEESLGKDHYKEFTKYSYLTDARRSELRALPRPNKGCKCGSSNHDFVHDPNCVLYGNIRHLLQQTSSTRNMTSLIKNKNLLKPFNAVEAAALRAELRKKSERESEEEEARFVNEMEKIQTQQFHKAVFAPSLTAMVLSAVVSLSNVKQSEYGTLVLDNNHDHLNDENININKVSDVTVSAEVSSDEEDDDDDVPLVALAPATKKRKVDTKEGKESQLNVKFMADMLKHISHTWGHVFKEPSHSDHSWRWEVFRGQVGSSTSLDTEAFSKNPRRPGSYSYETIKFCLKDKDFAPNMSFTSLLSSPIISSLNGTKLEDIRTLKKNASSLAPLKSQDSKVIKVDSANDMMKYKDMQVEDLALIAHFVSPEKSGLYDELMAMVRSGVLKIDNRGVAILNGDDWYSKVDVLLLNDMFHQWSPSVDTENKFCMDEHVRRALQTNWECVDGDWALTSDPFDIIHHDEEYEEWRRSFENTNQAQEDSIEGIGKFGF